MKQTFLYRVYLHNKKLFYFIIVFFGLTLVANFRGNEMAPFFVWGMYSKPEKPKSSYLSPKIIVNDSVQLNNINGFSPSTLFFLNRPLLYYIAIINQNNTDTAYTFYQKKLGDKYKYIQPYESKIFNSQERIQQYLPWLTRYIGSLLHTDVYSLKIVTQQIYFNNDAIVADSSKILAQWKK